MSIKQVYTITYNDEKCFFCEHDRPLEQRLDICKTCRNSSNFLLKSRMSPHMMKIYEKFQKDEEWANDRNVEFDRDTALMVLQDLSIRMRPTTNMMGNKILVISRHDFEMVRKKYLDKE